jgi:hypothetical protein
MDTRMNRKAAPAGTGVLSLSASGQQIVRIQAFKVVRLDKPSASKGRRLLRALRAASRTYDVAIIY